MDNYLFKMQMEVRDYECDLEGIVNNANYLHYMEHTRHKFIQTKGIDFADLHNRGIDVVVARLNISFKTPLKSNDKFESCLNYKKDGIKFIFEQAIFRIPDKKLVTKAEVIIVCIVNGKLAECKELNDKIQ